MTAEVAKKWLPVAMCILFNDWFLFASWLNDGICRIPW
jgi:hypothetical protein